jgi:hypothetical protein
LHDLYIMRGSSTLTAFLGRGFAVALSKLGTNERQVTSPKLSEPDASASKVFQVSCQSPSGKKFHGASLAF